MFDVLRGAPIAGRTFVPEDGKPRRRSRRDSQRKPLAQPFRCRSAFVGRSVSLDKRSFTVIGIMRAGFHSPTSPQIRISGCLWSTIRCSADGWRGAAGHWLSVIGRLKPGVSIAQAQAEMDAISARLAEGIFRRKTKVGRSRRCRCIGDRRRRAARASDSARRRATCAVDRLRKYRQSASRARHLSRQRNVLTHSAGRRARTHHPPIAHRKRGARFGRRHCRHAARILGRDGIEFAAAAGNRETPRKFMWTATCWLSRFCFPSPQVLFLDLRPRFSQPARI